MKGMMSPRLLLAYLAGVPGRAGGKRRDDGLARQLRQHVAAERLDPLDLIAAHIVQVHAVDTEVEIALDVRAVGIEVASDEHPAREVFRTHEPGHLLEVVGGPDVLLGKLHPAVWP